MNNKTPKLRFKGFTDAWEQRKLGQVSKRVQGNDGDMELPTLTISASEGWMRQEDRFSRNIAGKEQKNYTLLHKGELSYNHGNSKLAKYGTVFSLKSYEKALVPRVYHSFKLSEGNPKFLEYYFATKIPDRELGKLISSGARMDGLLNISYDAFMGISVLLPSVAEQNKISNCLENLDNLITLHQRKLEKIKSLKKAYLDKMFPKKGKLYPELRFAGFTDAWEQRKLVDLTARIIVGLATSVTPYYRKSGVPLLRNMNIKENYLDDSDILYLDEEYARNNQSKMIHTNDVLTVHTGANIGLTCLAPKEYEGCLSFTTLITTPKDTVLNSAYLMQFMNSTYGKKRINSIITAGGKPNLNSGDLEKLEVPYPKIDEQIQIGKFLSNLDDLITLNQRKLEKLKQLKTGYLNSMFI